jgi:hypothetical protein
LLAAAIIMVGRDARPARGPGFEPWGVNAMYLLCQDSSYLMESWSWSRFLEPQVLVFMIPITAIVIFGGKAIIDAFHRHRERMEMIRAGMHPDHPEAADGFSETVAETDVSDTDVSDTAHYDK